MSLETLQINLNNQLKSRFRYFEGSIEADGYVQKVAFKLSRASGYSIDPTRRFDTTVLFTPESEWGDTEAILFPNGFQSGTEDYGVAFEDHASVAKYGYLTARKFGVDLSDSAPYWSGHAFATNNDNIALYLSNYDPARLESRYNAIARYMSAFSITGALISSPSSRDGVYIQGITPSHLKTAS